MHPFVRTCIPVCHINVVSTLCQSYTQHTHTRQGDVVPLPAVADNAAVFCKIVRMDKKKPVCMEHLVLRPRTDGEVRGAVCPGWDVVPAVRPSAIASALPMGQILRASSKVWTGQPEECYRISCDTGDLALVATLSYIVCMGMASRLKK
eukprot:m.113268 g.113268  ORF g.113268 m.113268 type:complete len:149 (+) comp10797_c0_seq2:2945-3391(+)